MLVCCELLQVDTGIPAFFTADRCLCTEVAVCRHVPPASNAALFTVQPHGHLVYVASGAFQH